MDRQKVIMVGSDFGRSGDDAILLGLEQLASGTAEALHLMHVLDPRDVVDHPEKPALATEEEVLEKAPKLLAVRARALAESARLSYGLERVRTHARVGRVVETLLQACVDYDADLLIVGVHGRSRFDEIVMGSVTQSLVRTAHCPVLVARPKNYTGLSKTPLPDPPDPSHRGGRRILAKEVEHIVSSTTIDGWHPSDNGPTGIRIL